MSTFLISAKFSNKPIKTKPHTHDVHQIILVTKGSATLYVNSKSYKLYPGSLALISRLENHFVVQSSDDYSRYELQISPEIINYSKSNTLALSLLSDRPEGHKNVLNLSHDSLVLLFEAIINEFNNSSPFKDEMLNLYLQKLIIDLYRQSPDSFNRENSGAESIVRDIQLMFENDLSTSYTLAGLSKRFHISTHHLAHVFKRVTGYSVFGYLKALRMARAKTLLSESTFTVSEVASECGYRDISNFGRDFKEESGCSPREYRKTIAGI